jgi:RNA recognition motif. (a.k.a. RRM, RBD, or RNP domain)
MSGEDRDVDLNVPRMTLDKPAASTQVVQTRPDATSFDESGVSYDRATLYIAGVPKNAKEGQIRELFVGYGQIKNVTLFPNPREYFFARFAASNS